MPTFIILGKFTQKGIENIKDSPKRLEASRKMARSLGVELKAFYYTFGQYDFVAIAEAPDSKTQMLRAFAGGSQGFTRTETLVAIPAEEAAEIIKKLP